MTGLVVLTCASGKQCASLIPLLYDNKPDLRLRLIVHSQKSLERLQNQWPKAEVLRIDLAQPDDCTRVLKDASTLYYVGPPFQPPEAVYGANMVNAAVFESKRPGSQFSHFVLSSVLHPCISKLLNHDRKRLIEEHLIESGLPYTILQPSHFADNAIDRLVSQKEADHPVFTGMHDPNVAFSFTCVKDHAEVSAKVIREREKHFYATYQLASTLPMKYTEYIQSVGAVMGKTFEVRQLPHEEAVRIYCKLIFGQEKDHLDQARIDGPERLLMYYNGRGLAGNPAVLEWLLGRPGTTPAQLAKLKLERLSQSSA
ncbi:hypothetical protein PRZ48_011263 [Zasmidium cellare]|uniref:NmrA-like domain-containing protein n=1 Tax=Zasmidium cellare TaxID=395010 RepID=A0ABR0EAW1_ZASCE|nr:hypothetical protein PRZ48_011263 [Zasmidium cellare]